MITLILLPIGLIPLPIQQTVFPITGCTVKDLTLHPNFTSTVSITIQIENAYLFTFKLDFFSASGNHWVKEIFTARRQDHIIPGENIMFVDKKFTFHGDSSLGSVYTQFVLARLSIKGSSNKGNEFTVSCSFEI